MCRLPCAVHGLPCAVHGSTCAVCRVRLPCAVCRVRLPCAVCRAWLTTVHTASVQQIPLILTLLASFFNHFKVFSIIVPIFNANKAPTNMTQHLDATPRRNSATPRRNSATPRRNTSTQLGNSATRQLGNSATRQLATNDSYSPIRPSVPPIGSANGLSDG